MAEPVDVGQVVLDALRRMEKEIHAAAERVALAMYVSKVVDTPAFQAQVAAADEAEAAGFPEARPASEVLAELRERLGRQGP